MGKKQFGVYVVLTAVISIYLVAVSYYAGSRYVGDTALFGQIVKNIAYTGKAESNIFASTQDFIDRHIGSIPVEQRIADENTIKPQAETTRNMLRFHCCLILYLCAPLCYIMSPYTCLTVVQSISLALSLVFMIALMREKRLPLLYIGLAGVLLVSHPGWSIPAAYGAFYPERLFMGTGAYLIWACEKKRFSWGHFLAGAILCLLVGERGALYAGMFVLAHTIFNWKMEKKQVLKLMVGIFLLIYFVFVTKFVLSNLYYSNMSIRGMLATWSDPIIQQRIVLFLIINVVCYLSLSIIDWRAFIIGFCSMIPNLLYNVGGSEKIGWQLHYHVFYFVIVMWAVTKGLIAIYEKGIKPTKLVVRVLACASVFIVLGLVNIINPSDLSISFDISNAKKNIVCKGMDEIQAIYFQGGKGIRKNFNNFVNEVVPDGSIVTSIEAGMCAVDDKTVYLFPMGIKEADVAILSYEQTEDAIEYSGTVCYFANPSEQQKMNRFITEKMVEYGYDFEKASYFPAYRIAIVSKREY